MNLTIVSVCLSGFAAFLWIICIISRGVFEYKENKKNLAESKEFKEKLSGRLDEFYERQFHRYRNLENRLLDMQSTLRKIHFLEKENWIALHKEDWIAMQSTTTVKEGDSCDNKTADSSKSCNY